VRLILKGGALGGAGIIRNDETRDEKTHCAIILRAVATISYRVDIRNEEGVVRCRTRKTQGRMKNGLIETTASDKFTFGTKKILPLFFFSLSFQAMTQ
jgi:hypothetical protein